MSDRARNDETKQFKQEYTDADFLDAVRECTVASTTNVADEIGCNRKTALRRLKQLEADDELVSEDVGVRAKVWAVADE